MALLRWLLLLDETQTKVGEDSAAARGLLGGLFRFANVLKDFRATQSGCLLHGLLVHGLEYLLSNLATRRCHVAFGVEYALVTGEGKIERVIDRALNRLEFEVWFFFLLFRIFLILILLDLDHVLTAHFAELCNGWVLGDHFVSLVKILGQSMVNPVQLTFVIIRFLAAIFVYPSLIFSKLFAAVL